MLQDMFNHHLGDRGTTKVRRIQKKSKTDFPPRWAASSILTSTFFVQFLRNDWQQCFATCRDRLECDGLYRFVLPIFICILYLYVCQKKTLILPVTVTFAVQMYQIFRPRLTALVTQRQGWNTTAHSLLWCPMLWKVWGKRWRPRCSICCDQRPQLHCGAGTSITQDSWWTTEPIFFCILKQFLNQFSFNRKYFITMARTATSTTCGAMASLCLSIP